MRHKKPIRLISLAFFMAALLPACATATRGSTTLFTVETMPIGAKATTTVPTAPFKPLTKQQLKRIKRGEKPEPVVDYRYCEPTPCGIEVPRKTNFHVLVEKEEYEPQVHEIGYLHRKKIKKETIRNTAAAATVGGATIAGVAASTTTSTVFLSSGAVAGMAAIAVVTPIVLVGGVSMSIDASTGANYDPWPNPLPLALVAHENPDTYAAELETLRVEFKEMQRAKKMEVLPSRMEARKIRKRQLYERRAAEREFKRQEKEQRKAERNADANQ
jgi:hypothetical protein